MKAIRKRRASVALGAAVVWSVIRFAVADLPRDVLKGSGLGMLIGAIVGAVFGFIPGGPLTDACYIVLGTTTGAIVGGYYAVRNRRR